ncbi:MAG TPA: heme biosynthesis protein HemY, partial [Acetobacteraceae bacterium]|nr:heme biosynthesis protein HemY [Acetobacteraceae bacterium]
QALAREDWQEAAALARKAEAAQPGATWLRHERFRLAVHASNWSEALELADVDAPKAALAVAAAEAEADPSRGLKLAHAAWKQDASLTPAALTYAERLRRSGKEKRAMAVIRQTWTLAPHPDLAAFILAPVADPLGRVRAARQLAEANAGHVESRLLMARAELDAGLTGEARHQAEAARDAGLNQRRLWLLLADIEEAEHGDTEAGRAAQREALRRAASADPDPEWQCTVCRTPHRAWVPACRSCEAPGSLRWLTPETPGAYPVPALRA